ncbi:MAG TPA: TfpX/TfpZ family type IV pilin accessory protein [Methylibium sp.]|uniref:TfpX/TfpZ family type IV pilin accessory protein n=1 Tax=Methylibium sp. TaxID=2067992 RepID=UPI002DBC08F6|nr:TfpX/TfpZ family type IV pilin accessory protein [Methylibium sp.]HEU4458884.1 TfpX/TfpZ family type IV pilin accessory protein [Methylibium sp.]
MLVFLLWYPMPFREISGGRELFFIVVAVDVIVGPLITFAVFNRRKPRSELRRDVAIVALLQLAALGYGLHTVYIARPVAVVLEVDRLRVVTQADLEGQDLGQALPEWQSMPWHGVRVAAARRARGDETVDVVQQALAGRDIGQRPDFWRPSAEAPAAIEQAAKPLAELQKRHPESAARIDEAVRASGVPADRLKFLPLLARATDWSALIEATTGRIVGHVHVDGF